MSQDCSVPVLNDCTEISINDISVKDLCHHRPSQICIENETILTDNTDISASQVLGSKSFLERVQSMDIAALFPRGSLNQKRKKKKKTSNVSTASVSLSSESTSSFNKIDNIEENDVNLSGSTEDCSVADSFELGDESGKNCKQSINRICRKTVRVSLASIPEKTNSIISEDKSLYREATKAFNKKLYLKKKSVNVSFDSVSSEKSLTENTSAVKRTKNKVINVSFDSESPISRNLTEGNKSELEMGNEVSMSALNSALPSPSLVGSIDKKLTAEEQPTAGRFLSQKPDKENASRILTRNLRKRNLSNQISEDLDSPVQFQETDDLRRSQRKLKTKNKLQKRVSVHFDYDSSEQSCDQTFNKTINKNNDKRFADYNKTDVENMSMELESRIENDSLVLYPVNANVTTVSNTSMELVSRIEFIPDDDEAPNNKSVKQFNNNLYLQKKPVNVPFDLTGSEISMTEGNVSNSPLKKAEEIMSNNIKDSANELAQDDSEDGTQENFVEAKIVDDCLRVDGEAVSELANIIGTDISQKTSDTTAESDFLSVELSKSSRGILITSLNQGKALNKKMNSKKKSINFSFNLDETSDDIVNACVKTSDEIDSSNKKISKNINNNAKNKFVVEIGTQENSKGEVGEHEQMDIVQAYTSQPTSADISSSNFANGPLQLNNVNDSIPISNEDSTMKESISDTKSKVDYNDTEEKNKAFNKKLYLKKKSVNFSFNLGGSEMSQTDDNVTPCIKTYNGIDYRKTQSSVSEKDQESTENVKKDKSVNESGTQEQKSESMDEGNHSKVDSKEVSQEMIMIEPGTSQPTSGDISSSNLSPVQLNNRNDSILISNEVSTMKESISHTKSKVDYNDTEEKNKAFNKKLYLKKKSVNFSFDLGRSEMSQTDDNVTPCIKTSNGINYRKAQSSVSEKDQESTENVKKDKSVNESGTQEQVSESMVEDHSKVDGKEVSQEMNIIEPDTSQPTSGDISFSNLSPVQLNNGNDCSPNSDEESTMKESISDTKSKVDYNDTEEKNKAFNKKLYLKKKSVNFSFDLGGFEMSQTDDNVTPCIKTSNGINYRKAQSSVSEKDQESTENVKDKSVNESGTQEQMSKSMVEDNHSKVDGKEVSQEMNIIEPDTSQPTPGDISSSNLSPVQLHNKNECIPISNEESTMKESISSTKSNVDDVDAEEKNKVFNKKMYLKNKSVNISFTLCDSDMTCTDDNVNTSVKTSNGTDYSKTKCSVNEMVQDNIENGKKDKSVSESGTQEQMVEGDHSKVDGKEVSQEMHIIEPGTSQLTSADISSSNLSPVQLHNGNDCIPNSNEESISDSKSKVDDVDTEEKNKVFNKKLYLKNKSVNVSFTLGDSDMTCADNNVDVCVETSNETDVTKTKCSVINKIDQEYIDYGEKNKSVRKSGTEEHIIEDNHLKVDDKTPSQQINIIETDTRQSVPNGSNLLFPSVINGEEPFIKSFKAINKNLCFKNESVCISFDSIKSDYSTKETIQTIANQVSNTCNASLSSERINVTEDIRNDISNSDSTSPGGSFDGKFTVKKRSTDDPVQSENVDKTNVTRSSRKSNQSNKSVNLASLAQLQESDNLRRSQRNSKTNNKISKKVSVHLADTMSIKSFDKSLNNEINGNSQKTTSDINDISTQLDSRFDNDMQSDKKNEVNTNVNLTNPSNNSMQLNSKLEIIPDEKDSIESLNGNHFLKLEIDLEDGSFDGIIVNEIKKKMDSQETVHSDDIRKSVNNCFNNTAIENSVSSCIENESSESDPFPKSIIKTCDSFTPSILQDKNQSYKEKVTATSHQNNLEEPLPIESRNPSNNLSVDSSQDIICETDQNDNLHVNMETLDEMNSNEIEFSVNLFEQDNNNISERNRLVSGGATQENIVAEVHRNFTHEVVSQQINFVQSDFSQPATVNISAKLSSSQLDDGESDILINDEDSSKKGSTPEKNNIPSYEDKSEPREETNAESVRALNKIVCPRKKSVNTSIDLVMPKKSITLCAEDNSNEVMCLVNQSTQEICKKNDNIAAKFMEKDLQSAGETSSRQINIIERDVHIPISIEEYQEHTKNQVKNVSIGVKISKIIPFSETETPNGGNASTCSETETNNYKVPSISIESSNDVATHSHNINKSGDNESSRGEIKKKKSLKASKTSLTKNRRSTLSAKRNKRRSVTFATTARMKTDSQSGEIKLNSSFSDAETDAPVDTETDKRSETAMNTQMSIGLSIIRKENENSSDSPKIKKVCHSTPLAKHQKEKKNDQINLISNENYEQEHIFACPDIPARNLRERSSYNKSLESSKKNKRDTANDSDNSENVTKKSKISYYSGNVTDNSINDISIIPNMNNRTQKKMYHSTPIRDNKAKRKESNDRLKKSISAKVSDEEQVHHNDKMIQVSKTIFGSSTEGTSTTVSKKQSVYSNAYSNEEEVTNRTRSKRKSDGDDSPVPKRAKEMDSSAEDRSYHSNFISTLESESSYCTTRTQKRVTFKNVSKSGNLSTTDYRSSTSESSYYITRSSKKVGFREGISLIDETTGDNIRDVVNNSDFSIQLVAKDLSNDQSNLEKELTNRVESPTATLNYTAEEPEIILEENEIGGSIEMSTECSLFKKVKAISKNEKRDKTTATKKNEVIKTRQKKFKSSDYEAEALEKWVSKVLITFLNDKLIDDNLDYVVNTERIVSILCSAVNAVKHLKNVEDIDSALLPLKNILINFNVCSNMIEYATFISRFTPFEFQRKALSLGGYFSSVERHNKAKLMDSFVYDN